MKKYLFLAAASIALASCVNDEKLEMAPKAQKISFDMPVMGAQTRANEFGEIAGATYPTAENFVVYAKQHSGNFTGWDAATDFWASTGLEVTYDAGGYWDTAEDYFWPEDPYKLTFAAYSPATSNGTKSYGATGLTITDFESPTAVANQYDLMYSVRSKDNTEASNASAGATITFKHALSSIVFAAIDDDDKADYEITSLTLDCPNWVNKATFTQNINEASNTESPTWTEPTKASVNYNMYSGTYTVSGSQGYVTGSGSAAGNATAILAIPQGVPADAEVTLVYNKKPTLGSPQTGITKTVLLKNFLQSSGSGSPITNWEINGRYIYVFKFGSGKKIFFKPIVDDWVVKATGYITID